MSIKKRTLEVQTQTKNANFEIITPEKAMEYLGYNVINRRIKNKSYKNWAYEMEKGKWQTNGETIVFDANGNLKDGQHRLLAIVESNTPTEMLVVRGISPDVTIFDRGITRSISDTLRMEGYPASISHSTIVATAKLHFDVQENDNHVPESRVKDFIIKYAEDMEFLSGLGTKGKITGSRIGTRNASLLLPCFYAARAGVDKEKIRNFMRIITTGEYEGASQSAAVRIRNDILDEKIDINRGGAYRKAAVPCIEKALYDFVKRTPRRASYANHGEAIYSEMFRKSEGAKK